MTRRADPSQESGGFLELLGPRALSEISRNDDQVGRFLVETLFDRSDQLRVVRPKMQVGEMNQAGHGPTTPLRATGSACAVISRHYA